jgi:hypothetical protein
LKPNAVPNTEGGPIFSLSLQRLERLWANQTPFQFVMRLGRQTEHSFRLVPKVKKEWSRTSTVPYVLMAWCLTEYKLEFTFLL